MDESGLNRQPQLISLLARGQTFLVSANFRAILRLYPPVTLGA
jgi:hypothetical protein